MTLKYMFFNKIIPMTTAKKVKNKNKSIHDHKKIPRDRDSFVMRC